MIPEPLNYTAVRKHYMDIFGLEREKVYTGKYGEISFALPRFDEFVMSKMI